MTLQASRSSRLAALLIPILFVSMLPASAATGGVLGGTLVSATDRQPIAGMTVYVGSPRTGEVLAAKPTDASGRFSVSGLAEDTYELAVESEHGLYLVDASVALKGDATETVRIALATESSALAGEEANAAGGEDGAGQSAKAAKARVKPKLWSNPLTATLVVLGSAFALGAAVESATDDEVEASAF